MNGPVPAVERVETIRVVTMGAFREAYVVQCRSAYYDLLTDIKKDMGSLDLHMEQFDQRIRHAQNALAVAENYFTRNTK